MSPMKDQSLPDALNDSLKQLSERMGEGDQTIKELLEPNSSEKADEDQLSDKEDDEEFKSLPPIRKAAVAIVMNRYFSALIIMTIIANTVVLFMDRYPIDDEEVARQELANTVFYGIFNFELVVKLVGLGPHHYFVDRFNVFDLNVLLLSTVDLIISSQSGISVGRLLVGFRALRFLRIFKLARKWKSLQDTLTKLSKSFKEMLHFLILLLLFIFVYGLLGMELYSNMIKFDPITDLPVPCDEDFLEDCASKGLSPRVNFDNLQNAVVAVLVLIVGDNWNEIMADYVRATSMSTTFFFISLEIFGNIILLNLFLAILLRQFEESDAPDGAGQFEKSEYQELLDYSREKIGHLTRRLSTFFTSGGDRTVKMQPKEQEPECQSDESIIEEDLTYKNRERQQEEDSPTI